ncbi:MAG: Mov34/MPN/PAD-1 family protein, partial [Candidatus Bathyarchaeia archaeon]
VLASRELFEVDPEEFLAEFIKSEREGLQHIGFFHSHPGTTEPSKIDLKFMELWPGTIWLIISSLNRNIAAYRIVNGKLRLVYIRILHV